MTLNIICPNLDFPITLDVQTCVWNGLSQTLSVACSNNYCADIKLSDKQTAGHIFEILGKKGHATVFGEIISRT